MVRLSAYTSQLRDPLIAFWNATFARQRHFRPLTAAEWDARVLASPACDPRGLIMAVENNQVLGGVHAMRPPDLEGVYQLYFPRHHIAWLAVAELHRGRGIGSRLLQAAESYLYYCPVYFAAESAPIYGTVEAPRPPLFGSSQRMGVSLTQDRPLIKWLVRRGYGIVDAGDVTLVRSLSADLSPPGEPDWQALGVRPQAISHLQPWQGPGSDELRLWNRDPAWPYAGVVLRTGSGESVGHAVWYGRRAPTARAAIARLAVEEAWRGQGLGSYLLDRALHEMSADGIDAVEVQTHLQKHALAYEMYQRRRFQPEAAWANLVKQ